MTKEKEILKTIKKLSTEIQKLNKRMKKDPLLFYGPEGAESIHLRREMHVQGSILLRAHRLSQKSIEVLKEISLEK